MMGKLSGLMDVAFLPRFRPLFCHASAICAARFQSNDIIEPNTKIEEILLGKTGTQGKFCWEQGNMNTPSGGPRHTVNDLVLVYIFNSKMSTYDPAT